MIIPSDIRQQAVVLAENLRQLVAELGPRAPDAIRMAHCKAHEHALAIVELVAVAGAKSWDEPT